MASDYETINRVTNRLTHWSGQSPCYPIAWVIGSSSWGPSLPFMSLGRVQGISHLNHDIDNNWTWKTVTKTSQPNKPKQSGEMSQQLRKSTGCCPGGQVHFPAQHGASRPSNSSSRSGSILSTGTKLVMHTVHRQTCIQTPVHISVKYPDNNTVKNGGYSTENYMSFDKLCKWP